MRRLLAASAFVAAACATPKAALAPALPFSPVHWAVDHTAFLADSGCSGIRITSDVLLTAKHCLDDDAEVGDDFEGGTVKHIDLLYDFAVIGFSDALPGSVVTMRAANIGEHVWVVGYPMQLGNRKQELTVTDGIVAGPVNDDGESRITAPVYFGNSGGGVWGDDGALLGVAVSIYAARWEGLRNPLPYTAQSFMVPVERVLPYL